MMEYRGMMVFVQLAEGMPAAPALELLGAGRRLADAAGTWLGAMVLTDACSDDCAAELSAYGADRVCVCRHPALGRYESETFTQACLAGIEAFKPEVLLFSATHQGRDLAPRVAAAASTGLTADCTSLEIDPETGNLLQTRPAFGGNLMATIVCANNRPQMATVRPGVMEPCPRQDREPVVETVDVDVNPARLELKEIIRSVNEGASLEDAEIIVAGGRGIGGERGIALIEQLAARLGASVGYSRAAVEMGWADQRLQVGQTGRTVRPKIYIACGISGAVQHIVGMGKSKMIIAINQDPSAPIFECAHYGLVGDLFQIIPEWLKQLDE